MGKQKRLKLAALFEKVAEYIEGVQDFDGISEGLCEEVKWTVNFNPEFSELQDTALNYIMHSIWPEAYVSTWLRRNCADYVLFERRRTSKEIKVALTEYRRLWALHIAAELRRGLK